jgi:hypothetical protein
MDKLDEKNAESFGQTVAGIVKGMHDPDYLSIGILIENIYIRFQKEAERDARDAANGKRDLS